MSKTEIKMTLHILLRNPRQSAWRVALHLCLQWHHMGNACMCIHVSVCVCVCVCVCACVCVYVFDFTVYDEHSPVCLSSRTQG